MEERGGGGWRGWREGWRTEEKVGMGGVCGERGMGGKRKAIIVPRRSVP